MTELLHAVALLCGAAVGVFLVERLIDAHHRATMLESRVKVLESRVNLLTEMLLELSTKTKLVLTELGYRESARAEPQASYRESAKCETCPRKEGS